MTCRPGWGACSRPRVLRRSSSPRVCSLAATLTPSSLARALPLSTLRVAGFIRRRVSSSAAAVPVVALLAPPRQGVLRPLLAALLPALAGGSPRPQGPAVTLKVALEQRLLVGLGVAGPAGVNILAARGPLPRVQRVPRRRIATLPLRLGRLMPHGRSPSKSLVRVMMPGQPGEALRPPILCSLPRSMLGGALAPGLHRNGLATPIRSRCVVMLGDGTRVLGGQGQTA